MSDELSTSTWRRSRYCVGEANCVEIADMNHDLVGMRDSKVAEGHLTFTKTAWRDFIEAVKQDRIQP
jgi:hypothetical protein